nr:phage portal protein [Corynebacterium sp. 76QC2CO]
MLDRLLPKHKPLSDHTLTGGGYSFIFGGTSSGRPVTERSAMQMTAVYSCVRILAEAVAGLPLHVYRERPDGGKGKATDHSLYRLLHDGPNPEMTSFVFRETLMMHLLLWGNAFAQIIRNGRQVHLESLYVPNPPLIHRGLPGLDVHSRKRVTV